MKRFLFFLLLALSTVMQSANNNWMASLPDALRVCRVSIPGTHDSGTAGVRFPMRHYARTQTLSIGDQWDAGIRFFDLRPKLDDGELKIFHGPADCHISFSEALLIIRNKLEQDPAEFCIIMTNLAGGGDEAAQLMSEQITSVIPPDMIAPFAPDIAVADVRGKVLFIHRNMSAADAPGTITLGWPGNGTSRHARISAADGANAILWAQDYFTLGKKGQGGYLKRKWSSVQQLAEAFESADGEVWCINHTSGYTGKGVTTNIRRCSNRINASLLEYLDTHKRPIGIVPMDFPSQELIDAIILLNKFTAE